MLAVLSALCVWFELALAPATLATPVTPSPAISQPAPTQKIAPPETKSTGTIDVTGYCATGHNTASGVPPQVGMAAGNRWPFGTRIAVPGYGRVVITDRIGWGSDLDLYMGAGPSCQRRALRWGRHHTAVTILP